MVFLFDILFLSTQRNFNFEIFWVEEALQIAIVLYLLDLFLIFLFKSKYESYTSLYK